MDNQGFHPKWKFHPMALHKMPILIGQWLQSRHLLIDETKEWCRRQSACLPIVLLLQTIVKEVFMEGAGKKMTGAGEKNGGLG